MDTKICSRCKIEKPISRFAKDSSKKDGFNCHCRQCVNGWLSDDSDTLQQSSLNEDKCGWFKKLNQTYPIFENNKLQKEINQME